jgi:DNA-binding Lrp family transcriptional regulator|tara:strand:- start:1370 stop:1831 length:462 start_codon:yes stop_codon:yes gene_type:complete
MDDLDRAILEKLCEDARLSQRKLAQLLGVAQGTVTKRMQRMEESGLIKNYAAVLDAEKVGWSMTIMAGLRIQKGRMIEVQEKIASDPRVFNVYDITGDWDSMVLARVKDRSDLDNLTKTVFTQDGVIRSYTHVVLNTVKEEGVRLPRLGHEHQ